MSRDIVSDSQVDREWRVPKPVAGWRVKTANWLSLLAVSCFITEPVFIACLFYYAWQIGLYPHPNAAPVTDRGAWSYHDELVRGVFLVGNPFFYAGIFSVLSLLFESNWRAGIVLIMNSAFFFFCLLPLIGLIID